jgi:hypothetical protein
MSAKRIAIEYSKEVKIINKKQLHPDKRAAKPINSPE